MVYRGKPSAGCEPCRRARKKCDGALPFCDRCTKANRQCSGYRDTSQLQVEDESAEVIRKARKASDVPLRVSKSSSPPKRITSQDSSATNSPPGFVFDFSSIQTPDSMMNGVMTISAALRPSKDEVATNFFWGQFVTPTHWAFMFEFAGQAKSLDPCISNALQACGMASLSNQRNIPLGKAWSRQHYAEALASTNVALRSPSKVKKDETLVAVLLLSLYENMTCDSRDSITAWKAHIEGATEVLRLRGYEALKSTSGLLLFRELRAQIMVNCMWNFKPVPAFIRDWPRRRKAEMGEEDSPPDELAEIAISYADLRAAVPKRQDDAADLARQASVLEEQLLNWASSRRKDSSWGYETVRSKGRNYWHDTAHIYVDAMILGNWNMYRAIRMMLTRSQESIWSRLAYTEDVRSRQHSYLTAVRNKMSNDICASVPTAFDASKDSESPRCLLVRATFMVWPLFFAGTHLQDIIQSAHMAVGRKWMMPEPLEPLDQATEAFAQLAWIIRRLEFIKDDLGIHWAAGVIGVLKRDLTIHEDYHLLAADPFARTEAPQLTKVKEINDAIDPMIERRRALLVARFPPRSAV